MDGINGRSIQTLLRGENDSKQSDEIQARSKSNSEIFPCGSHPARNNPASHASYPYNHPMSSKYKF